MKQRLFLLASAALSLTLTGCGTGAVGTKKWEFLTGGDVHSTPALGRDGSLYVGSWDGKVYAIR